MRNVVGSRYLKYMILYFIAGLICLFILNSIIPYFNQYFIKLILLYLFFFLTSLIFHIVNARIIKEETISFIRNYYMSVFVKLIFYLTVFMVMAFILRGRRLELLTYGMFFIAYYFYFLIFELLVLFRRR